MKPFSELREAMPVGSQQRATESAEHLRTCRSCPDCTPCDLCDGKGWRGDRNAPVRCGAPVHQEAPYYAAQ